MGIKDITASIEPIDTETIEREKLKLVSLTERDILILTLLELRRLNESI